MLLSKKHWHRVVCIHYARTTPNRILLYPWLLCFEALVILGVVFVPVMCQGFVASYCKERFDHWDQLKQRGTCMEKHPKCLKPKVFLSLGLACSTLSIPVMKISERRPGCSWRGNCASLIACLDWGSRLQTNWQTMFFEATTRTRTRATTTRTGCCCWWWRWWKCWQRMVHMCCS